MNGRATTLAIHRMGVAAVEVTQFKGMSKGEDHELSSIAKKDC
jgi:hypothetical protein